MGSAVAAEVPREVHALGESAPGADVGEVPSLGATASRVLRFRRGPELCTLEVYVVINADTHPELGARLRTASPELPALAVTGQWVDLAVPRWYHEPSRALWVLLLPPVLRHLELDERLELQRYLAQAPLSGAVPSYLLSPEVVTSIADLEALRQRQEGGAARPRPATTADELAAWQAALAADAEQLERHQRVVKRQEAALGELRRAPYRALLHAAAAVHASGRGERWRESRSELWTDPTAALLGATDEPLSDPALLGRAAVKRVAEFAHANNQHSYFDARAGACIETGLSGEFGPKVASPEAALFAGAALIMGV
ncbi:MAG TPA: hypothetical protein PKU97_21040, partial [Kofleriaceae bacterium]|nr:hypothetical protein [Kofleriaceae bacterium]